MPTSPESATTATRSRRALVARRAAATMLGLALTSSALLAEHPASAQTVSTAVSTGVSIAIAVEAPAGADASKLPTGNIRVFFTINNPGPALTNQQAVIRVGRKPDEIASVSEGTDVRGIGIVDTVSGAWYHTIPQIPAGGSTTLVLSMIKVCGGKWPIAVRVGDKLSSVAAIWKATSDARCAPDENASPAPASYYQLAWPAASGTPTTTTSIVPQGATVSTAVSTGSATTMPAAGGTATTLLRLGGPTATTTSTTSTTSSTIAGKAGVTTTTVIFCKTIGGKRYCAPKSSVYKDGQTKAVEISSKNAKKTTKKKK